MGEKTTFDAASFRKALIIASQAAAKASTLPILTMIRVQMAALTASDTKMQISAPVEAKGAPIDICLPADKLRGLVDVAGDTITITATQGKCVVASGKHKFNLATLPGSMFPEMQFGDEVTAFEATSEMNDTLARVCEFAADNSDVRYQIRGAHVDASGAAVNFVATNGISMAYREIEAETKPFAITIPTASCQTIAKGPPGRWTIGRGNMMVETKESTIIFKLVDGSFPLWRNVIPKTDSGASMLRTDLAEVVGLTRFMSVNKKVLAVRMVTEGGEMLAEAPGTDGSAIESRIPIEGQFGCQLNAGFDAKLFSLAMKAIDDKSVAMRWSEPANAAIGIDGSDGMRVVIMPMRV